ncbi:MAG: hypothetical protein VB016_04860 [Methanomassiliicoccaceae archaeon]|nr:hypothetical protein [Methanomassiliicoccaceae archaeon]
MGLKNKKGFTATVDAMIFIVMMTIAFSAMFSLLETSEKSEFQGASDILPLLLESDVEIQIEEDCGPVTVKMCEALVYGMYTDCDAARAAEEILDSHFLREGAYVLTVQHNGMSYTVGSGAGTPGSSFSQKITGDNFTAVYILTVY